MTEHDFHRGLALAIIALGALTAIALRFISAPYGRHARAGWGPTLSARAAWIAMEAPASLGFLYVYLLGSRRGAPAAIALLALWQAHYAHRAFVYPFRARGGRPMPLAVAMMGAVFNLCNAYLNARQLSELGVYPLAWLWDPRFLIGASLFVVGVAINLRADEALRALRAPGETGYKIPRGGLYEYVSSPNYLGELIAWTGWAVATWSLAGAAFALFSAANLVPRAATHHAWYRSNFDEYPAERRALIPFVW